MNVSPAPMAENRPINNKRTNCRFDDSAQFRSFHSLAPVLFRSIRSGHNPWKAKLFTSGIESRVQFYGHFKIEVSAITKWRRNSPPRVIPHNLPK
ncbi:hypothetical protein CEXT_445531 [Caerostris extrusa]|uniref:Uncharacterized protein n=1 Tax=Caerostris extrusa TaxID=172846 RepID=A0AAV4PQJ8_CAEEX|nr:hypothetical protein CEXT_445531 [Caerostris extrusa]